MWITERKGSNHVKLEDAEVASICPAMWEEPAASRLI